MKNRIKPFSSQLNSEDDNNSRTQNLDQTLDVLFKNLKDDALNGRVKITNMADLARVMNVQALLDDRKQREGVPEEQEYNVFDDILSDIDDKEINIDELYNLAFDKYNQINDDKNKED